MDVTGLSWRWGGPLRNTQGKLQQVQHSLVLVGEAEHTFSSSQSAMITRLHFLLHQRNLISVASSHPLKGKITGSNPNRKQSPDMVANLLPASEEIATFTPYVSDPPEHTQSSSVTHTHTFVCLAFANNL